MFFEKRFFLELSTLCSDKTSLKILYPPDTEAIKKRMKTCNGYPPG
jgi:hypothetical protein